MEKKEPNDIYYVSFFSWTRFKVRIYMTDSHLLGENIMTNEQGPNAVPDDISSFYHVSQGRPFELMSRQRFSSVGLVEKILLSISGVPFFYFSFFSFFAYLSHIRPCYIILLVILHNMYISTYVFYVILINSIL